MSPDSFMRVNASAFGRITELLPIWLPGGRQEGQEYVCASLDGGQGRSCKVNLATGKWADFATDEKGGDLVSLFAAIHGLRQSDAAQRIAENLGITPNQSPYALSEKASARRGTSSNSPGQIIMPVPSHAPAPPDILRRKVAGSWVKRIVAARWAYQNEQGQILGYVCRFNLPDGGKEVVPQVYGEADGKACWQWKGFPVPRPLYGLDRLAALTTDDLVLVCEGEKTADAARRLLKNAVAVTWPGGSKAVNKADFGPLGGKTVIIWPDADRCGYEAAIDAAEALASMGTPTDIVLPPASVKSGWDLADAEAESWDSTQVMQHIKHNALSLPDFKDVVRNKYGIISNNLYINPTKKQNTLNVIRIEKGASGEIVDDCEAVLAKLDLPNEFKIFQRGSQLVRLGTLPTSSQSCATDCPQDKVVIMEAQKSFILDVLGRYGRFVKLDHRSGELRAADPPKDVAETITGRAGLWPMPPLRGILTCPTLRPDGTLLLTPGYDPKSQYYFAHRLNVKISSQPTHSEATNRIEFVKDLLSGFSFVEPVDRTVALALILSTMVRPILDHMPLFAITAPVRGSGKSYLMDIAAIIATGRRTAVLAATTDRAELEKRLTGSLLSGDPLVSLDNCNGALQSDLLCQAITASTVKVRPLGASAQVEIPSTTLWSANGNNLVLAGDLPRRSLLCRLDPGCERPEERKFSFDPLERVLHCRTEYVSAVLTILRAYIVAGRPDMGGKPFGGFGQWSALVRGALRWVGEPDPCASRDAIMDDDPELAQLRTLLPLWWQEFGKSAIKIKQLIERSHSNDTGLYEVLDDIVGEGKGPGINARSLGHWLKLKKDNVVCGLKLLQVPGKNMASWQVVQVKAGEA
ncbi:DNA primase [Desulfovibrio sp. TomC]|nr:DNA primase [Desulfovibrio sp. TomC]